MIKRDHVSYSELAAFRQCPKMHWLGYREGWQPAEPSKALTTGKAWHEIMEAHYKGDNARLANLLGVDSERGDLLRWMYKGYKELYEGIERGWKTLAVEHVVMGALPPVSGASVKLKGVIDLVFQDERGRVGICDHKTASQMPNERKLELDDQMGDYWWLLEQLGRKVDYVLYNVARTQRNKGPMSMKDRFGRWMLYRNPVELATVAQEGAQTAASIRRVKKIEDAPRHVGEHCSYRCSFTEVCLASRKGVDLESMLEAKGFVRESR